MLQAKPATANFRPFTSGRPLGRTPQRAHVTSGSLQTKAQQLPAALRSLTAAKGTAEDAKRLVLDVSVALQD